MRRLLGSTLAKLALASALFLGAGATAPPALADEQLVVGLELSTLAPPSIVEAFHQAASDDWLTSLYPQFAAGDRAQIRIMAVERTARGVRVRIAFKEDLRDTSAFRTPVEASLAQLAQGLPRPYSYTMKDRTPAPASPRPRWEWLIGLGVLALLALLFKRRPGFLSQPSFGGLPMAGVLPAGLGMGGKFLELQSAPCQTMGVMVRETALARGTQRVALATTEDPDATAVVAAALGISLVREGDRVLVVDLLGEDSVLADVLDESDEGDPVGEDGNPAVLRHTGIPDLDLLDGMSFPDSGQPMIPSALLEHFDWTLLLLPKGKFVAEAPTFMVFTGPTSPVATWRARLGAWLGKAPLLGAILVGVPLPDDVRDRMIARSYFERIRRLEEVAP